MREAVKEETFRIALFIAGHDDLGRPLAKLINLDRDYLEDEPFKKYGNLIVFERLYPLPAVESHPWETSNAKAPWNFQKYPAPPSLPTLKAGDIITALHAQGAADHEGSKLGETVRLTGVHVRAHAPTENDACRYIESMLPDRRFFSLVGPSTIAHNAAEDRAKLEPHEALVLVWIDSVDKSGSPQFASAFLGSSGSWFFHYTTPEEAGVGDLDTPGLYFFHKASPWSYGDGIWEEFDCGIDGEFTPATAEHLKNFGLDPASARAQSLEHLEDHLEETDDPFAWLAGQGAAYPEWAKPST